MSVECSFYQREVIFIKKENKIAAMDRFSTNVHMFKMQRLCLIIKKI